MKKRITVLGDGITFRRSTHGAVGGLKDSLVIELDGIPQIQIEDLPDEDYVQVQVSGASPTYPWTYIDPSGELEVGDRVLVPFGYDDAERVAKVTALGKGVVPAGVRIKRVAARLDVEELV